MSVCLASTITFLLTFIVTYFISIAFSIFLDDNECNMRMCPWSAYCTNLPGTFKCTCRKGFKQTAPTTCEGEYPLSTRHTQLYYFTRNYCGWGIRRKWIHAFLEVINAN